MKNHISRKENTIQTIQFYSELNGEMLPYKAILPVNYFETEASYPVFYLMHGLFGSFENWTDLTDLSKYTEKSSFVIICPEGKNSWYLDNESLDTHYFESYILDELISDAEQRFRIKKERNSRFIGGLSMGGYAAFKFAFRRPQMFRAAVSSSGAFDIPNFLQNENNKWAELQPYIAEAFENLSPEHLDHEDVFRLAQNFPAEKIKGLPFLYFDCGKQDSFIEINQRFKKLLENRGIEHSFLQTPGGHDWDYWDKQIKSILDFLSKL